MKELLIALDNMLRSAERAMLATIVEQTGSAPRGVGTSMAVSADGSQSGTIGGGSMEHRARANALEFIKDRTSGLRKYTIHTDETGTCSGGVKVLFRLFSGEDGVRLIDRALACIDGEEGYLVCELHGETVGETRVVPSWLAKEDEFLAPLLDHAPILSKGEPGLLVEPLCHVPRAIVLGGGHIAQALVPILAMLHYRVWVIDEREELCDLSRFPLADRVIVEHPVIILRELDITERDSIVSFIRSRGSEWYIAGDALRTKAGYIGCIGSHASAKRMRDELRSRGFSQEQIARIHSPIGLDIGAETPEEIAVSIAAELIQSHSKQ